MWTEIAHAALFLVPILALLAFVATRHNALAGTVKVVPDEQSLKSRTRMLWGSSVLTILAVAITIALYGSGDSSVRLEMAKLEKMPLSGDALAEQQINSARYQTPMPGAGLASVDEMIERLEHRLARSPNDVEGWRMLGWSYLHTDRPRLAIDGYRKAVILAPNDAGLRSSLAEALIADMGGKVTDEARTMIDNALQQDPKDRLGRYLRGLDLEQSGNRAGSIRMWQELLGDNTSDDTLAQLAKEKIAALRPVGE